MSVDPLSDVLQVVRLNGAFFYAVEATEPWSVEAVAATELTPRILPGSEHLISYHILTSGHCWGGLIGRPQVEMQSGDVIVFPHGEPHMMSSAPGQRVLPIRLGAVPGRYPDTVVLGEGDDPRATLVCGFLGCDRRPYNPLLATLPSQIHLRGLPEGWLRTFAHQVVAESRAKRAGAESILKRLAELMFVEVLRRYIEVLPAEQSGWLAGLRDEFVARSLALMHGRPAHPWTIGEMASQVGLSRSSLAARFADVVGQSPMQYLAQWRMQLAAGMLTSGGAKVSTIALRVGYDSEAAFSRAFKRHVGMAPADWRKAHAALEP